MKTFDIQLNVSKFNTREHLATCLGCMDLTSLNATDTDVKIAGMAQKVNDFPAHFPDLPQVAAICVFPSFTSILRNALHAHGVQIAVVGGGFPASQTFTHIKIAECRMAVEQGANEVDIVLSLNHFLSGEYARAQDEVSAVKDAIGSARLKVIIESGALATPDAIAQASRIAIKAGADFIKTSTGKSDPAATPQAAGIICGEILAHYKKTGKKVGFKPAGGITTPQDALAYYAIVSETLGSEWLTPGLFRIGASRLANHLLAALGNRPVTYF